MKQIIVVIAFVSGIAIPSYSQIKFEINGEKTFENKTTITFSKRSDFSNIGDILNKESFLYLLTFNDSKETREYLDSLGFDMKQLNSSIQFGKMDRMPCLKLQGSDSMPYVKPDSTISFSLLIKKLE